MRAFEPLGALEVRGGLGLIVIDAEGLGRCLELVRVSVFVTIERAAGEEETERQEQSARAAEGRSR